MSTENRLTEDENRAMRVLWDRGSASAAELASAMSGPKFMNHASALSLLRKLKSKGAVARHRMGAQITYQPCLSKDTAPLHALGRLLANSQNGGTNGLGFVVLRDSDFDPQDIADLKAERAAKADQNKLS